MLGRGEVIEDSRDTGTCRPLSLLRRGEALLIERFCFGGLPLHVVDAGKCIQALHDIGALGPGLFPDAQTPLRQGFGLGSLALGTEHPGEMVEGCRKPRVVLPEGSGLLLRGPKPRLGLGELSLFVGVPSGVMVGLPSAGLPEGNPRQDQNIEYSSKPQASLAIHRDVSSVSKLFDVVGSMLRRLTYGCRQSIGRSHGLAMGESRPVVQSRWPAPTVSPSPRKWRLGLL